jgi:hypothetical protein
VTVTTKVQPIDQDIKIFISDLMSPEAQSSAFADFAEAALADAQATDSAALGYVPNHTTFVDGIESTDLERVNPNGTIVFVFDLLDDMFAWIFDQLKTHAPFLHGNYRESIKLYADGAEIEVGGEIPPASQFVFLSTVAYASKIEGSPGRPPQSSQAPDGVFQVVATMAKQRFGNQAKISFAYIAPSDGGIVDWARSAGASQQAHRRGGNKALHTEWLTRVPAIVITVK